MTTVELVFKSFGLALLDQIKAIPRIPLIWWVLYAGLMILTLLLIQFDVRLEVLNVYPGWWDWNA